MIARFLLLLFLATGSIAADKPNLILIYADDLGWRDVSFNGSDFHETPHLDRMARRGIVFPNGYAGAGNCAPSRACLHSGTYAPRHGLYAVGQTDRGPKRFQRLVPIPNRHGLDPAEATLAEALKTAGYTTGIFGKWHIGGSQGADPGEQGFDVVFDSQPGSPNPFRDRPTDPKGAFSITRAAIHFIEKADAEKQPFFAFLSHHAIHTALESTPGSLEKFKAKAPGKQHHHPLYAACTFDLDASVGQLMARLDALGLAENTLVVFTSDNGGTQQSSQEPLRGSKGGYYEGGIRVPFLAIWPGKIEPRESPAPVHQVDLYPTFLAAAGAMPTDGKILDGANLLPLLTSGEPPARPALFWHFPGYLDNPVIRGRADDVRLGFRSRPVSVIRKGDWKLHLFHEEWVLDGGRDAISANQAVELYHLAKDPGEHHNLATTELAKTTELLDDLLAWIATTKAPVPSRPNPAYDAEAAGR